ncbi:MAG: PspC domain-containing protein [Bacteroidetes bacterium]|nr:PspC domain-containing protein [Bacteroidota bacterium]
MRKTLNINLAGMAFIMDENAYELLHGYLDALKQKFNDEAERKEILNDIEARIAEMLGQNLAKRKEVVSQEEVQLIIDAMGKPEDIAGEEPTAEETEKTTGATVAKSDPVKKKLFRDPDEAKIGGLISGLCHYFGINDPVWIRIAAIILIFVTYGNIIWLYLLLLIIVPKANTAAEKLQMKGEPINITSIQKEVKEAASRASSSVEHFVREENFFEKLWDIFTQILKVAFKLAAIVAVVFAMIALVAVSIGFGTFYLLGTSSLADASRLIVDNTSTISLFSFGFLLFCATPIIAVIYLSLKIILGHRSPARPLKWILLASWVTGLVLLLISGYKTVISFRSEANRKEQLALIQPAQGTLAVQLTDGTGNSLDENESILEDFHIDMDGVYINGTNLRDLLEVPIGKPHIELMPAVGDSFYIQEITVARGRDRRDAEQNAASVIYKFSQTDTTLNLNPRLYISKNRKFRAQKMKIRLAIPEGKKVQFADNIDYWQAVVKDDPRFNDTQFANTVWTVEGGKVKCLEGENHSSNKGEDSDEDTNIHSSKAQKRSAEKKDKNGDF